MWKLYGFSFLERFLGDGIIDKFTLYFFESVSSKGVSLNVNKYSGNKRRIGKRFIN